MRKLFMPLAAVLLGTASLGAVASEASVKAAFLKKYPNISVESVVKTPVTGIYELYAGGQLVYADEKVNFLFLNADLVDAEKKSSLSQERMLKLTAIKFDELPLDLAFKKVKGKGTRKLAYFGDPNCGYCKKFEQDLAKIDDVTVYIFAYPVLGPDSLEKSKSIWCSKDRAKAWDDQLLNGIAPTAPGTCNTTAIEKTLAFGKQKNINGTPTMFFVDGTRIPGAISAEQLEQRLAAASRQVK